MIPMQFMNTLHTYNVFNTDEPKLYTREFSKNLAEFL